MYRFREMVEMEGAKSSKSPPPPPISDMFQKFAIAFKTKTYELFTEDYHPVDSADSDGGLNLLLDSAEEFIPDQKVVVVKPDLPPGPNNSGTDLIRPLIPTLFATLSSFEASYLQFQAAHVPEIDQNALELAYKLTVSILKKLTEMKSLYRDSKKRGFGSNCGFEFPAGSYLEFQVQENQSKLRVLETIVNSLQSQMDDEASDLRRKLDKIRASNGELSQKNSVKKGNYGFDVLLTIRVLEAMLGDSIKSLRVIFDMHFYLTLVWECSKISIRAIEVYAMEKTV
ncbi:hypothetical protein CASFOL_039904 [Castilleja foliolosa]|uniref:DUF641 domain-containing protein n=1 Tax=Castilleja foliolosa TaxID=1961234 RepID=A0ABD3BGW2_9LAMI